MNKRSKNNKRNKLKGRKLIAQQKAGIKFNRWVTGDNTNLDVPLIIRHSEIDHDYGMVLVRDSSQVEFNTSIRFLDGVPKNIADYMRTHQVDTYRGMIYGRPGHVASKRFINSIFEKYGTYQAMMIKLYRLSGVSNRKWHNKSSAIESTGQIITDNLELLKLRVSVLEKSQNYSRKGEIYRDLYRTDINRKIGEIPNYLL